MAPTRTSTPAEARKANGGAKKAPRKAAAAPVRGLKRPATLDHLKKGRPVEVLQIVTDEEAAAELKRVQNDISALEVLESPVPTSLREERDALQEAVNASLVEIKLQSIGRKAYDALVKAHPATDEQNQEQRQEQIKELMDKGKTLEQATALSTGAPYNVDTFAPALISACAIEPELTPEDVEELYDAWNLNEYLQLWMAAVRVNNTSQVGHWGKAYG